MPRLAGEKHLYDINTKQFYNYCGPGTKIKEREGLGSEYTTPINCLDSKCKLHDYDYQKISESKYKNKDEVKQDVLRADILFKGRIANCPKGKNEIAKKFITGIFNIKNFAEKIDLANPNMFVNAEIEQALKGLNLVSKKKVIKKKTKKVVKKKSNKKV